MAKTGKKSSAVKPKTGNKKSFEEKLDRLEKLGENIRKADISLDESLKAFEEGIRLARDLEKELDKIESRVDILMNNPEADFDEKPELGLFDDSE